MENGTVSIARIQEIVELPGEDQGGSLPVSKLSKGWPAHGSIVFDDIKLRYAWVLHSVYFAFITKIISQLNLLIARMPLWFWKEYLSPSSPEWRSESVVELGMYPEKRAPSFILTSYTVLERAALFKLSSGQSIRIFYPEEFLWTVSILPRYPSTLYAGPCLLLSRNHSFGMTQFEVTSTWRIRKVTTRYGELWSKSVWRLHSLMLLQSLRRC